MKKKFTLAFLLSAVLFAACDKVSPIGLLIATTAVEDRVKMSYVFYQQHLDDKIWLVSDGDYSFLVGADSHLTTDPGRMDEMLNDGIAHGDLFIAHLGDIADTKAEYYVTLDSLVKEAKKRWVPLNYNELDEFHYVDKRNTSPDPYTYTYDEIVFPFFPVVGNHDITHNGWAMWSHIFGSSFYEIDVIVLLDDGNITFDHLIFLDTASGTLGRMQINLIQQGILDGKYDDGTSRYRHTFVFSHTNIFYPQFNEMASTFSREETFFMLDKFEEWNVTCAFCGHVHTWDERNFNGVHYLTLDSMCEKNSPKPGDYLVRMNVKTDGEVNYEKVHMNYVKPDKKK